MVHPPDTAKSFLTKLIKVRGALLAGRKGIYNMNVLTAYERTKRWVDCWPNAPEEGCRRFIKTNAGDIRILIPGNGSGCHRKFIETFNLIVYGYNRVHSRSDYRPA